MKTRIYDRELLPLIDHFPVLDLSDVPAARRVVALFRQQKEYVNNPLIAKVDKQVPGWRSSDPPVKVRIYTPERCLPLAPALIHFHGGGFCFGDLDTDEIFCQNFSEAVGAILISVDYRLSPEHPFPAALEDGLAVSKWVFEQAVTLGIDSQKVAIGGRSAGGCLAAAVALLARDARNFQNDSFLDFALQLLFFPVLDDRCQSQSMKEAVDTPVWNQQNSIDMWRHYIGENRSKVSPYAAVMRAKHLKKLPPAYIVTAEHDPLRDEALMYARRLMGDGVSVEFHNYSGAFHVFDKFEHTRISRQLFLECVAVFRKYIP